MSFSSKTIANAILDIAQKHGVAIDHLKLQKLVYVAHGWWSGATRQPLVSDEVEAWEYGPVFPDLYHAMKRYGGRTIDGRVEEAEKLTDTNVCAFLEAIWDRYGALTGLQLSDLSHQQGSPWSKTKRKGLMSRNTTISQGEIVDYYASKIVQPEPEAVNLS